MSQKRYSSSITPSFQWPTVEITSRKDLPVGGIGVPLAIGMGSVKVPSVMPITLVHSPLAISATCSLMCASGDYTAVTGVFEGTFTQPMPIGNGKTIKPTGKAFKLPMCTVGHWKGGVMDVEYLFWDNQAFMKQVGLAQ